MGVIAATILVLAWVGACSEHVAEGPVAYRDPVAALLAGKCASCHSGGAPAGGWRADDYLGAIGCVDGGAPATVGSPAPLLAALDLPPHTGLLSDDERATLVGWLSAGAPAFADGVHAPSFMDPRSPDFHGAFLRARRWAPMLDARDRDACGVCHEGAPARPDPPTLAAPGATPCTTCHAGQDGPLGCATCHSANAKGFPPRDRCFFPGDLDEHTHAAHVESRLVSSGVACATCHPTPNAGAPMHRLEGTHADGAIEVWLPQDIPGVDAHYDPATKTCTARCHLQPGGARPSPVWGDAAKMTCGDCHGAPPPGHPSGVCNRCHLEPNAAGTAIALSPKLHMNGVVDLGDGSGTCGACHGHGDDPWPTTGAHAAHAAPTNAPPVPCATCHVVPTSLAHHPVGGAASVRLVGLAAGGGRAATYDPTTKTCANVYCHELPGAATPKPRWDEGPAPGKCGGCHSVPPPPPHSTSFGCGFGACHAGSVEGLVFTVPGAAHHVDGHIDLELP
jgi:predicted CxxxxCH...CXXCH cytochrome family protein